MGKSPAVFKKARGELKKVEALIEDSLKEVRGRLSQLSLETLQAGGKRLRPLLVLTCGQVGSYNLDRLLPAAAGVELVHMASLVHDDILDKSELRRGLPTINHSFGRETATATGDFLFARAFILLARTGKAEVLKVMSETAVSLSWGELRQMETLCKSEQTLDDYLEKIKCKTASLFSAACRIGSTVSEGSDKETEALAGYGYNLGMAFQIYDDILDFVGSEERLGKPVGTDLQEGTVTMPMLFALQKSPHSQSLARLVEVENLSDRQVKQAIDWVVSSGALKQAKEEARKYVDRAVESIGCVEHSEAREELAAMGQLVIERYH